MNLSALDFWTLRLENTKFIRTSKRNVVWGIFYNTDIYNTARKCSVSYVWKLPEEYAQTLSTYISSFDIPEEEWTAFQI